MKYIYTYNVTQRYAFRKVNNIYAQLLCVIVSFFLHYACVIDKTCSIVNLKGGGGQGDFVVTVCCRAVTLEERYTACPDICQLVQVVWAVHRLSTSNAAYGRCSRLRIGIVVL